MHINRKMLREAAQKGIINQEQAERLYGFIQGYGEGSQGSSASNSEPGRASQFTLSTVLYYSGGLVAIGAMTLFMNLGWEMLGGWGIFFISLVYAAAGLYLAARFKTRGYAVPAAICATFTVAVTPLAVYGLQQAMGWWPDHSVYRDYHHYIRWHWIYMELCTLAAGCAILWFFRYPFLLMPIAVTLWYMSMDVAVFMAGGHGDVQFRAVITLWFGLSVIAAALIVDVKSRHAGDYAFWLYMAGVAAFWGGMMTRLSHGELERFLTLILNFFMILTGVALSRRVFMVFGAVGCAFYLGHLAWKVFRDSIIFPFALTFTGLFIIYLGILWPKNEMKIAHKISKVLPNAMQEFIENRQA